MKYLNLELILRIHERVIAASGGDPAVLDMGRLDSAVAQPRMGFGGQALYPTLAEKAAALAFSLSMNHPFADGNKRTSYVAMRMFLQRNMVTISIRPSASMTARPSFSAWRPARSRASSSRNGSGPTSCARSAEAHRADT